MNKHLYPNASKDDNFRQLSENQAIEETIRSLSVENFRNIINGLAGKDSRALVAAFTTHPKLIYIINGGCQLRKSEPFEMLTMNDWYFVYKKGKLLFSNKSREITEKIFTQCVYYEELESREQEKAEKASTVNVNETKYKPA